MDEKSVLVASTSYLCRVDDVRTVSQGWAKNQFAPAPHLSITRVCRQIHSEASLIYYAQNTFHVWLHTDWVTLYRFANTLCAGQRLAVQHLEFGVEVMPYHLLQCIKGKHRSPRLFVKKSLTDWFPALKSVKITRSTMTFSSTTMARILKKFPDYTSAHSIVEEMFIGGFKEGIQLDFEVPSWLEMGMMLRV